MLCAGRGADGKDISCMHWIQGEKPVEYHVVRWDNSTFHNHDKRPGRKMLGGVSFDGGGGGGNRANTQQTGVQMAQPSFSHTVEEEWFGNSMAETGLYGGGSAKDGLRRNGRTEEGPGTLKKQITAVSGKRNMRDTMEIRTAPEIADNKITPESAEMKNALEAAAGGQAAVPEEKRSRAVLRLIRKAGNGIQAFLRGMEQKAGQKNHRKPAKKHEEGTRTAEREIFDRMPAEQSYLLDSYNKYGERSTLGR